MSGTGTVNSDLACLTPTVSYSANNLLVTLASNQSLTAGGIALPDGSRNMNNVAGSLTKAYLNGRNALTTVLIGASPTEAAQALSQVSGKTGRSHPNGA